MTNVIELRRSVVKAVMPNGKRLSFGVDETDEDKLAGARRRWKELKAQGAALTWWRRQPNGKLLRIA